MSSLITPGTYTLTCDITNPSPDRRVKRDWRAEPVIKAGTVFCVVTRCEGTDKEIQELREQDAWSFQSTTFGTDLYDLIALHLVPMTEVPSDYLARVDYYNAGTRLLDILHAAGKITMVDVEQALEKYKAQ